MTVAIFYEHVSPHQVACLRRAAEALGRRGMDLLVVEQWGRSRLHGWTLDDAPRPPGWICLAPDGRIGAGRLLARAVRAIRERRVAVTVVNGWSNPLSVLLTAMAPALGTRVVTIVDSTEVDRERNAAREAAKRLFLRRVGAVFAAGTRQLAYLRRLGVMEGRVTFGCDVVENGRFAAGPARPVAAGSRAVVGTAARLVPEKNLTAGIRGLAAALGTDRRSVVWRIAGRGPLEAGLRDLAETSGVDVRFEGFLPYDRMPGFYAGLDLYWQPSLSEPWGLAINEAMASGLPILASDRCGCADDLIGPENGWLHGPDPEGVAAGLACALAARERWSAMGAASRRRIAAWDLDRFASGLLEAVEIARARVPVGAAHQMSGRA